jgi:hypothetical protein
LRGQWETSKSPPRPVRRYLYTTNQLERLAKEIKRRTKAVEVFCGEGAVENLLYLVLSQLDEAWGVRRLRGFAEIQIRNYHVALTYYGNYVIGDSTVVIPLRRTFSRPHIAWRFPASYLKAPQIKW